jgi:hypothetical protein
MFEVVIENVTATIENAVGNANTTMGEALYQHIASGQPEPTKEDINEAIESIDAAVLNWRNVQKYVEGMGFVDDIFGKFYMSKLNHAVDSARNLKEELNLLRTKL